MSTLWKYKDRCGVPQTGYFEKFTDFGGTDITYYFRRTPCNTLDLVSGSRLKDASRIWPERTTPDV